MTRLERLRDRMAATNTDLVALAPGPHMRWLLRFAPSPDERACFLLVGQEQAGFVMPALNASDARQHTDLPFWEWRDDDGPDGALEAALQAVCRSVRSMSVDERMRADHAFLLLDAVPNAARGFASETVGALRMIKEPGELAALRENARIADLAQSALRSAIREGITERELANVAKAVFEAEGAHMGFGVVGAGAHSSYPHHHTVIRRSAPVMSSSSILAAPSRLLFRHHPHGLPWHAAGRLRRSAWRSRGRGAGGT
jgi:Xaa-Pro aminopeptidase